MAALIIKLFCWGVALFWLIALIASAGGGSHNYAGDDRMGAGSDY